MRVTVHPAARQEASAAARWYRQRQEELRSDFHAAISTASEQISERPYSFQRWTGTEGQRWIIRKAPVHRFPYLFAFQVLPDRARILAIVHGRRRPLYWLHRAGDEPE